MVSAYSIAHDTCIGSWALLSVLVKALYFLISVQIRNLLNILRRHVAERLEEVLKAKMYYRYSVRLPV